MRMFIRALFRLFSLSAALHLFVHVFYFKFYFPYNFKYQMVSGSSYVGITGSAQFYKKQDYGLRL